MSKISELSDGGSLQSTDYLIAVRSGGNVKVRPNGAVSGTTGQFSTSLNVDGTVTADGLTVDGSLTLNQGSGDSLNIFRSTDYAKLAIGASSTDHFYLQEFGSNDLYLARVNASVGTYVAKFASNGDISFYEDTGTTPKFFWDASAESLALSNAAASSALVITKGNTTGNALEISNSGESRSLDINHNADGTGTVDDVVRIKDNGTTKFVIDENYNVGIGTTSPGSFFSGANQLVVGSGSGAQGITIYAASNDNSQIFFADGTSGADAYRGIVRYLHNDNAMAFYTDGANERMRIDASGNLILKGNDLDLNNGTALHRITNDNTNLLIRADYENTNANSTIQFSVDGTERARIDSSGALLLNPNNATRGLKITTTQTVAVGDTTTYDTIGAGYGTHVFKTDGTERLRIDSSGNLLVGKTSTAGTAGVIAYNSGALEAIRDGAAPLFTNRLTSDGDIAVFRKDGTTVGSIGSSSTGTRLYIGNAASGRTAALSFVSTSGIYPYDGFAQTNTDGTISLGTSFARFDDIYATNGTIQTSDANEKQDIAELDEAERRAAVAAKGLLRKFRWKGSVAEKGDDARIHFGIIAQDLQAAFEAEGLDAGRYAMFIHSTWTDEETGEERSRMGVRYNELLAFIIAAL